MDWPLMLRPLPRPVAPFRDETITSYLRRLAEPNRLDPVALRVMLTTSDRKDAPVPLSRLAAITGMPARSLAYAMPQLCSPDELAGLHVCNRPRARPRWAFVACRHCVAGQPVTRWALHDDVICSRHHRWISEEDPQPDLTRQPEILHAHRQHRWLIRRHGRNTVMRAVRDAQYICIGWRLDRLPVPGFDQRMTIFHGQDWEQSDFYDQTFDAAAYPQTVALTRLLASPYWRERILDRGWPGIEEFAAEVRRTVAPWYSWDDYPRIRWRRDRDDPLREWRTKIRWRMESEPLPPEHEWNQPETITAADPNSSEPDDAASCPK